MHKTNREFSSFSQVAEHRALSISHKTSPKIKDLANVKNSALISTLADQVTNLERLSQEVVSDIAVSQISMAVKMKELFSQLDKLA
jgi:hypothetical protein|tara:strand:+ start:82 stop:339 length:258 start_codon:yes stop_codon:yes gene_type:complete